MISLAHAQTAGASADPTGGLMQLLPMILMFAVLWFLMVRPQMKKAKEHKALIAAIAKGGRTNLLGFPLRLSGRIPFLLIAGRLYGADALGRLASALVIIDVDDAIALGYAKLNGTIRDMIGEDGGDAE